MNIGSEARLKRNTRQRILNRDGNKCHACGMPGNSVDHIVPRNSGGYDDDSNLRTLCISCNSKKGVTTFNIAPSIDKGIQRGLKNFRNR